MASPEIIEKAGEEIEEVVQKYELTNKDFIFLLEAIKFNIFSNVLNEEN